MPAQAGPTASNDGSAWITPGWVGSPRTLHEIRCPVLYGGSLPLPASWLGSASAPRSLAFWWNRFDTSVRGPLAPMDLCQNPTVWLLTVRQCLRGAPDSVRMA